MLTAWCGVLYQLTDDSEKVKMAMCMQMMPSRRLMMQMMSVEGRETRRVAFDSRAHSTLG